MMEDSSLDTFYTSADVDIEALRKEYNSDVTDLGVYNDHTQDSYNQRYCQWPGKSATLRKDYPEAQPFEGASDQEVRLIENAISTYVALFMNALGRSNIRAFPIEATDIRKSKILSSFLKYMRDSMIPSFRTQMELAGNYLLEKGLVITYVGWEKKKRPHKQTIDVDEFAEVAPPELVDMFLDEDRDEETIAVLQEYFDGVNEKRAKKFLKELRESGVAELPVIKSDINRPSVRTLAPDGDVVLPNYVMDIQSSPRITLRALMTVQEIENRVANDGWDADWADDLIENYRGISSSRLDGPNYENGAISDGRRNQVFGGSTRDADDLVEVLFTYRRLIDEEDGAEGIYLTVWHAEAEGHGLHELQNGMTSYPFVATRLLDSQRRLYDVVTFADMLRGPQRQAKVVRDGWTDQQSMRIAPPFLHPAGRAPSSFGAGAWIGVRPTDRYEWMQVPGDARQDTQIEEFVMNEAYDLVGLNPQNPLGAPRQQFYVDKFLHHCKEVLKAAYKAHVLWGEESIEFRVTGQPEPITLKDSDLTADLDVSITFDTLSANDPEMMRAKVDAFMGLMQSDASGRINQEALLEVAANMIDPSIADQVLQPLEASRAEVIKKVAEDLALIWSGQSVGAQPNGANIALEYIQGYMQKGMVQQRIGTDPEYMEALQLYIGQYEQQLAQQQNAVIGRLGTEPAELQGVNT